ncbi:hypothetical protein [Legionella jordanis]|uniref:Uncharacterized protein n=1 Tax=Legionella jordanis TaxID=456 RepID=A0A0W0VCH7_9GAMM|nr:hypothetical protein [Legionella jordanis]KTD17835.1 hypothetical protein Ljor_2141 [Legionella jordanis]RMX02464.1 hypothetical protein EAW55_09460 [Legionella jordanis]RMX21693.1 hypothetical protein EAS68_02760 [Legionella jordanis]VEH11228.1 Uncharacterised protein [Legionella jordanis]HAT8713804.1 hypothetical protein [Legionella jordanis]
MTIKREQLEVQAKALRTRLEQFEKRYEEEIENGLRKNVVNFDRLEKMRERLNQLELALAKLPEQAPEIHFRAEYQLDEMGQIIETESEKLFTQFIAVRTGLAQLNQRLSEFMRTSEKHVITYKEKYNQQVRAISQAIPSRLDEFYLQDDFLQKHSEEFPAVLIKFQDLLKDIEDVLAHAQGDEEYKTATVVLEGFASKLKSNDVLNRFNVVVDARANYEEALNARERAIQEAKNKLEIAKVLNRDPTVKALVSDLNAQLLAMPKGYLKGRKPDSIFSRKEKYNLFQELQLASKQCQDDTEALRQLQERLDSRFEQAKFTEEAEIRASREEIKKQIALYKRRSAFIQEQLDGFTSTKLLEIESRYAEVISEEQEGEVLLSQQQKLVALTKINADLEKFAAKELKVLQAKCREMLDQEHVVEKRILQDKDTVSALAHLVQEQQFVIPADLNGIYAGFEALAIPQTVTRTIEERIKFNEDRLQAVEKLEAKLEQAEAIVRQKIEGLVATCVERANQLMTGLESFNEIDADKITELERAHYADLSGQAILQRGAFNAQADLQTLNQECTKVKNELQDFQAQAAEVQDIITLHKLAREIITVEDNHRNLNLELLQDKLNRMGSNKGKQLLNVLSLYASSQSIIKFLNHQDNLAAFNLKALVALKDFAVGSDAPLEFLQKINFLTAMHTLGINEPHRYLDKPNVINAVLGTLNNEVFREFISQENLDRPYFMDAIVELDKNGIALTGQMLDGLAKNVKQCEVVYLLCKNNSEMESLRKGALNSQELNFLLEGIKDYDNQLIDGLANLWHAEHETLVRSKGMEGERKELRVASHWFLLYCRENEALAKMIGQVTPANANAVNSFLRQMYFPETLQNQLACEYLKDQKALAEAQRLGDDAQIKLAERKLALTTGVLADSFSRHEHHKKIETLEKASERHDFAQLAKIMDKFNSFDVSLFKDDIEKQGFYKFRRGTFEVLLGNQRIEEKQDKLSNLAREIFPPESGYERAFNLIIDVINSAFEKTFGLSISSQFSFFKPYESQKATRIQSALKTSTTDEGEQADNAIGTAMKGS